MGSASSLQKTLKKTTDELSVLKNTLHLTGEYLQCILQNIDGMIFSTDAEGVLISLSRGGEKILGYSTEHVQGRSIKDFLTDARAFENFMASPQEKGNGMQVRLSFRHKDERTIEMDATLIHLTNTEGGITGIVGICRNNPLLVTSNEELRKIDRLAEVGRMTSGIMHEINNPIAIIKEISGWVGTEISSTEGLAQEDRVELDKALRRIDEQIRRCRNIIQQVLGYARDPEPKRTSFDINELLIETIRFLKPELKLTSIETIYDLKEEPFFIKSDSKMLEQVFVNVITNAIFSIKAKGNDKGQIFLRTRKIGSNVEIMISDNGTGISEEDQNRIFDLFYSTKPSGKGTGLGLPICRDIMNTLGGEITFETKVGEGATFIIKIPVS